MAQISVREALRETLRAEMKADERILLMGEDIGAYGGSFAVTKGLLEEFGEKRVRDMPIAEGVIVGTGVGAAMLGLRPIVELMTINFALVAIDQIINNAAKLHYMFGGQMTAPVVIRTAAGWGQLAATHSQTFETYFAHVPGLRVVMPATAADHAGLLRASIYCDDPVVFIEHTGVYGKRGEAPDGEHVVPIGVSDVKREGSDITIVTYSRMLYESLDAAEQLAEEGIEAEVIDLRTLRPLDMDPVIESVKKTHRCLIAEEDWPLCGIGAEIASRVGYDAFGWLDAPIARVHMTDVPMPYARNLEQMAIPRAGHIVEKAKALVGGEI